MFRTTARRRSSMLVCTACTVSLAGLGLAGPAVADSPGHHRSTVQQLNLVSDVPGAAQLLDPNLVNPWGLSASPTSPIWVSNNGTDTSTLYRGATKPGEAVSAVPLVVAIPGGGAPTGQVFNSTSDFALPTGGKSLFIFAGEDGDLSAWNGAQGSAAVLVAPSTGGVYKGLALLSNAAGNWLLAANFHDDRVEVFDSSFHRVLIPNAFAGKHNRRGYAPFNVAVLGGQVYVSYAKQDGAKHDDVAGRGHGFVDVFDLNGHFRHQLDGDGSFNSPWGMALAPAGFGEFGGDLLVGNFGDGRIHAFKQDGDQAGTLRATDGRPLAIDGLWGLLPGNGVSGGTADLWFSAGPDGESHGLLGILRTAPAAAEHRK